MGRDKIKSEPIDGFVYEVHQLPATKGEDIGRELVAMGIPVIGAFAGEGKSPPTITEDAGEIDLNLQSFGLKAASDVFSELLSSPRLKAIRILMAQHTDIYGPGFGNVGEDAEAGDGDGGPLSKNYDDHFAGRYDAMLEWFMFALEVNFKGFFVGLWGRMAKRYPVLRALPAVLSNLHRTSTGGSGDSSSPE